MVPNLVFRKTFERSLIYQLSLPQKTYLSVYAYPPPLCKKKSSCRKDECYSYSYPSPVQMRFASQPVCLKACDNAERKKPGHQNALFTICCTLIVQLFLILFFGPKVK